MLEEQLGRRGDAVAPLRPVLRRILADIQERLTFRAQAFIKVGNSCQRIKAPPKDANLVKSSDVLAKDLFLHLPRSRCIIFV